MGLLTETGALRATSNAGLQPAMDFLLEHVDDPIPDPSAQSAPSQSAPSGGASIDEDDEEDAAALRAAFGSGGAAAAAAAMDVEAKVSLLAVPKLGG